MNTMLLSGLRKVILTWKSVKLNVRSASTSILPPEVIVITDDASTIVAWHPKQDFPYECTLPLPEKKFDENTTVLKTQMTSEVQEIFKKKTPEQSRHMLMGITHTTKHRWFPRARDKKAKKTPMDREYL